MPAGVVIVGAGQAGYQAAASLRTEGYEGSITLIGEEPHLPYQRPPLSKAFVMGKQDQSRLPLRPESFYRDHRIDLLTGERAIAIERAERRVRLKTGRQVSYDTLVLALGARNRPLPLLGAEFEGVCYLRTLAEGLELKQRMEQAQRVAVIGGGFVGMEIAASACAMGKHVTVMEALPRLMARAVAPTISEFLHASHIAQGIEIILNAQVLEVRCTGNSYEVLLGDGRVIEADVVIAGVGVVPNMELANEAGLPVENGILADRFLRTEDPNIFAIGDCAAYPNAHSGTRVRLESVQNAADHGVSVARTITGKPAPYNAVPWFWSDQADIRLQMAGLAIGHEQRVVRGDPQSGKFSVFYFRSGRLCAVDSVNRPADHMAARKLLGSGSALTPEQASDESVNLKML